MKTGLPRPNASQPRNDDLFYNFTEYNSVPVLKYDKYFLRILLFHNVIHGLGNTDVKYYELFSKRN